MEYLKEKKLYIAIMVKDMKVDGKMIIKKEKEYIIGIIGIMVMDMKVILNINIGIMVIDMMSILKWGI